MRVKNLLSRYRTDDIFRNKVKLYTGATSSLIFVVIQFYGGIKYQSGWFTALAVYYIVLMAVKFYLAKSQGRKGAKGWTTFRIVGFVMTILNFALIAIIAIMIANPSVAIRQYSLTITIVTGIWTLVVAGLAIRNLVKVRKKNSPVALADKLVQLVAAMVSVLILQTATIASVSTIQVENALRKIEEIGVGVGVPAKVDELFEDAFWGLAMSNDITGLTVATFTSGVTVYMIVRGTIEKKRYHKKD